MSLLIRAIIGFMLSGSGAAIAAGPGLVASLDDRWRKASMYWLIGAAMIAGGILLIAVPNMSTVTVITVSS